MSIDKLVSKLRPIKKRPKLKISEFNKEIKKLFINGKAGSNFYLLLPSWGGKFQYCQTIINKIYDDGNSFLTYEFPKGILSADIESTKYFFENIEERVNNDLDELKIKSKYSQVNIIGVSVGNVNSSMVVQRNPIFDRAFFIVPGHCLAEAMWAGYRTQYIKEEMQRNGITIEILKESWKDLAPENNLDSFKGIETKIYISPSDKIIGFKSGMKLVNKMKRKNLNPKVKKIPFLGHYGTSYLFFRFPNLFGFKNY